MTTPLFVGLGVAAAALGARFVLRGGMKGMGGVLPKFGQSGGKAGFQPTMDRKEASKILGLSPNARFDEIKVAHRRIMLLNHPDSGGSPFVATKINEAKEMMVKKGQ